MLKFLLLSSLLKANLIEKFGVSYVSVFCLFIYLYFWNYFFYKYIWLSLCLVIVYVLNLLAVSSCRVCVYVLTLPIFNDQYVLSSQSKQAEDTV